MNFELRNSLIYYIENNEKHTRLCVLNIMKKNIFRIAYNKKHYKDANRCYNYIVATLYILRLSKKIRIYINHCLSY